MRSIIKAVAKVSFLLVFSAASVSAAAIIKFDQVVEAGMLSYAVAGGTLVGTDIGFDNMTVAGAPMNNGFYTCSGCKLNFTSGPNITPGPGLWQWGAGGSFTLTGNILGIPALAAGGPHVLLSGTFSLDPPNVAGGGGGFVGFFGFGVDDKNADLLAHLGITSQNWRFATTEISSGNATINADGTFTAPVDEADLTNIVPAPGTTLLMLLGLSGIVAGRFRRR